MTTYNGYKVDSSRAKFWDYGGDGLYFVTICTGDKKPLFGEIRNDILVPSEMGIKAEYYWYQIPIQYPYVELDYFILMPNHLHGIVGVYNSLQPQVETRFIACPPPQAAVNHKPPGGITGTNNPMGKGNLSEIIRWFKGRTSFEIRKTHPQFSWQRGYHDHIIQDAQRYEFICNYIIQNPGNWKKIHSSPPE